MPIYEYRCKKCKKTLIFFASEDNQEIDLIASTVKQGRDQGYFQGDGLEERRSGAKACLTHQNSPDLDENDPRSVERVMRRMGKSLGTNSVGTLKSPWKEL